jgi:hypothetical protein
MNPALQVAFTYAMGHKQHSQQISRHFNRPFTAPGVNE